MSVSNIPDAANTCIEKRRKSSLSLTNSNVSNVTEKEDTQAENENDIKVVSDETNIIEKYDENCSLNSGSSNHDDQQGKYIF